MDKKNRKILAILSNHARLPHADIGKKARVSKDTVAYRMKSLEKQKVITGYTTFFDFSRLGLRVYKLFVKLKGMTDANYQSIQSYFQKNKRIGWVVVGNGAWDMIVGLQTRNIVDVYVFKSEFECRFNDLIAELRVNVQVQAYFYPRNYLHKMHEGEILLYSQKSQTRIDKKDVKILQELAKNSRESALNIAHKTGLSARTIGYRIRRLRKLGIILEYRASINLEKIGYVLIKAFIKLQKVTPEIRRCMLYYFKEQINVVHNVECLGDWELEPEFEVEDIAKFYATMKEFRLQFAEYVARIDSMMISKEYKYQYVPFCEDFEDE